ncbi:MAG: 3-dehydroquinate synthase [Acutalibacteraceae bacterium]|nr:3-dehydroquinate synthase [Acutalibacteraceae bacterium]
MIIPVSCKTGKYDIVLQKGALENAGTICNLNRKVLIVTDDGVPCEYAQTVAKQCKEPVVVTLPQGEATKCFESYKQLLSKMVSENFTRSDCVVAVGGGVMGDLAGFVAASFMRGVDFYNIPTTVLSQVDSSIGGKVAIDFDGYKNLVGAFYQPKAVIIDTNVLETLSARQKANGLAEAVKMAMTSNDELFELFEKEDIEENLQKIIYESLMIKKSVVEQDEKETGLRKILNFGHTVAHAIESDNEMKNLYHGECVALGMIPMCSEKVRNRLTVVLEKIGLPIKIDCDIERIVEAMKHDKKKSGDSITVISVEQIGQFKMEDVPFEHLVCKMKEVL